MSSHHGIDATRTLVRDGEPLFCIIRGNNASQVSSIQSPKSNGSMESFCQFEPRSFALTCIMSNTHMPIMKFIKKRTTTGKPRPDGLQNQFFSDTSEFRKTYPVFSWYYPKIPIHTRNTS